MHALCSYSTGTYVAICSSLYVNICPVPSPNVSITSNPTGLIAIGGSVTLKCTVLELSPSAGVQVTVSTEWTGPDGFMATNLSQPVMGNTTTTVVLSSFGRDQSGEYTCTATVNSMSPFIISSVLSSSTTRVTVGNTLIIVCACVL